MPRKNNTQEDDVSSRPFWSGVITFGLVSVPVNLFPAIRHNRFSLRMLSPEGRPLSRRYYAPEKGNQLSDDQMIRGYEIEKDEYVIVTDEELERLAPEQSRSIDLQRFVEADQIPAAYFERSYFLIPTESSEKAYQLLVTAIEKTRRAGIATFVMRGKEYLIAILPQNGILQAETLRFPNEIRTPQDIGLPGHQNISPAMVQNFEKFIRKLSKDDISTEEMKDSLSEELFAYARKKKSRKQDVVQLEESSRKAEVIDIMEALKRSLSRSSGQNKRKSSTTTKKKPVKNATSKRVSPIRKRAN